MGLSLSIYILYESGELADSRLQGCVPVIWVTISEIFGRKPVYIISFIVSQPSTTHLQVYTVGSVVASRAPNMQVLIGMRCLQALGSSAVLSAGAGSLADMYEVHERGKKLGIFYGMPMLAPSVGPLLGGALGNAYGWRSTMYFLAAFAGVMTIAFFFFPDTWRRERSRLYQKALGDAIKRHDKAEEHRRKRERKKAMGLASGAATPATRPSSPVSTRPPTPEALDHAENGEHEETEKEQPSQTTPKTPLQRLRSRIPLGSGDGEIRPSFKDLNPLPAMMSIWRRPSNAIVLICSGWVFAAQYTTTYTASVTFARAPYNYNPLIIGVVLLSFGLGNIAGSILGGRWSDYSLKRQTAANKGVTIPEMRLKSTLIGMPVLIASYLVYAWTTDKKTNIAGPVVALFTAGFSLLFIYSSTLAYLVDSNPGRSASAVSCNSAARGVFACIMSQVAMPIQNAIGDGGLYTLFAGLLVMALAGITWVGYRGERMRQAADAAHDGRHVQ